jgi:outer membrane protein insertion porin family
MLRLFSMMVLRVLSGRRQAALLAALLASLLAGQAFAVGERITDVRVMGNVRTAEDTIRSLAGVQIGDVLEGDTLASVRERLNTAGLFADVNVWWENKGEGVRVNIAVKDKFPWAPVPTGSWSANNKSVGLLFVHGNLFGRGKQMAVGGRYATLDSGGLLAYRDPALFGTWIYWELKGIAQRQVIPEYNIYAGSSNPIAPWRETTLDLFGFEPAIGVAWFRRVKTQVSWRVDKVNYKGDKLKLFDQSDGHQIPLDGSQPDSTHGGITGVGRAAVAFDWRAREFAVMTGPALGGNLDIGSRAFKSDFGFWRASVFWEQGIRFFRRHNFIYILGATIGKDLPMWWETTAGGNNLRGYLGQQFRGDTQLNLRTEYHFPLFSIGSLDFRALGFYDFAAVWYRNLPLENQQGDYWVRPDGRTFNVNYIQQGFDPKRDVHNDVGGGLRFFLRSVAVPLVGIDAGWGVESHIWRFLLIVGA